MAISGKLQELLNASKVTYTTAKHPTAYTAQELAAALHVPGRSVAKSVLVKTNRGNALAVLPAVALIDLKKLKAALKAATISIGKESDIKAQFPDVEVGAMSPFGNLYGVPVVAEKLLSESSQIVFNAGSHTDTITMPYEDFARLVKPTIGVFALPIGGPKKAKKKRAASSKKKKKPARRPSAKRKPRRS